LVCFLGSGKTALLRALCEKDFDPDESLGKSRRLEVFLQFFITNTFQIWREPKSFYNFLLLTLFRFEENRFVCNIWFSFLVARKLKAEQGFFLSDFTDLDRMIFRYCVRRTNQCSGSLTWKGFGSADRWIRAIELLTWIRILLCSAAAFNDAK
jgi:hypothetical protein